MTVGVKRIIGISVGLWIGYLGASGVSKIVKSQDVTIIRTNAVENVVKFDTSTLLLTNNIYTNILVIQDYGEPFLMINSKNGEWPMDWKATNTLIHSGYRLVERGCDDGGQYVYEFQVP